VCEAPVDLPELERAREGCPDFRVALGVVDLPNHDRPTDFEERQGRDWLTLWDRSPDVVFRYSDTARFRYEVSAGGTEIVVDAHADVPPQTIRHLLIDDVIPHAIARSGVPVFHGAGVAINGEALLIVGDSAVGKSTLSVALARAGGALIADDCVVVDPTSCGLVAEPSYASARLSEHTARALLGDRARGRPFTHYSHKLRFSDGVTFATDPVPIRGVVRVDRTSSEVPDGAEIATFDGHAACATLVQALRFSPRLNRATTVEHVVDLADQARVGHATINHDLDALPDACGALLDWLDARR
jgi:hypothetical protein